MVDRWADLPEWVGRGVERALQDPQAGLTRACSVDHRILPQGYDPRCMECFALSEECEIEAALLAHLAYEARQAGAI